MKHIFEGNWIYLAHESQIPNPNDYFTTYIGRQPIVITRDKDGRAATPHQRLLATAARCSAATRRTTRPRFTCPFHGWTFNNSGKLLKVKDPDGAGYPDTFNKDGSPRPDQGGALRELPRLPVRQPQPRRAAADRAPRRADQDHRHDRRPVARWAGGAARLVHLHLRRQLEAAGRERRRRLPRQPRCTGTTPPPPPGASTGESATRHQGAWTPAAGPSRAAASTPSTNGHLLLWTEWANPRGPAAVGPPRRARREVRRGQGPTG